MILIPLKLRGKLLVSFVLVTLIGTISSMIGLMGMYRLQDSSIQLYEKTTKPMINLIKLTDSYQRIGSHIRDAYLAGNEALANKSLSIVEGMFANIDQNLQEYGATLANEDEKQLYEDFKSKLASYQQLLSQVAVDLSSQDSITVKQNLDKVKSQALLLQINLEAMVDAKITQADTDMTSASQTTQTILGSFTLFALLGIALSLLFGLIISGSIAKAVKSMGVLAQELAQGNLDYQMDLNLSKRGDELGGLSISLQAMNESYQGTIRGLKATIQNLESIVFRLQSSVGSTNGAVLSISSSVEQARMQVSEQSAGVTETAATINQIIKGIHNLDREIEDQAASVTQSSASVEEMVGNIQTVTRNISLLGENFAKLMATSDAGNSKIQGMMGQIQKISQQSESLVEANRTIASIAAQTNLLAMNAAIEAAHAGQSGLGFAVVADEIRKLAELAGRQSKEVSLDIKAIRSNIDTMVSTSGDTTQALGAIMQLIQQLGVMEKEINQAMSEQSQGSRQVLEAIATINTVTANVKRASGEIATGSQAIAQEMQDLNRASEALHSAISQIDQVSSTIKDASAQVTEASQETSKSVDTLVRMVGSYRLSAENES